MNENKDRNAKNKKEPEHPRDPYTGEPKPPAEDAGKIIEIQPVDAGEREGEAYLLEQETSLEALAADEHADAVSQRTTRQTIEEEIEDDFAERQELASGGRAELKQDLEQFHSKSPRLSGGDLDADWQSASAAGEETVGGSAPTPDQDSVTELGEALGITYDDDEPIRGEGKLLQRDQDRWELDPASARQEERPPEPPEQGQDQDAE